MNIKRLGVSQYRNLGEGQCFPCPGINVICGRNAQGKTNLLEGLWLCTGGRSFRGAKDSELVAFGEGQARLCLDFYARDREQRAEITIENGRRKASLNGVDRGPASSLIGELCAVVFSPVHLSLVKEGPVQRRRFLDAAICQQKPAYAGLLARYTHTLTQRNALLKDVPRHAELLDTLDIWEEKLARYGGAIAAQRISYAKALSGSAAQVYEGISEGKERLSVGYESTFYQEGCPEDGESLAKSLREKLMSSRREDLYTGHTGVGPHRDDLHIEIDGRSARSFGSQGQQRSCVLALKLAEASLLYRLLGERPVVLLDDVMSELDQSRQDYLLNHIEGWQVFITCCDPDTVGRLEGGAVFQVEGGVISQVSGEKEGKSVI